MDFDSGLVLSIPIAIFTLRWFRRFMSTETRLPQWDNLLKRGWLLFIVFFVIGKLFSVKEGVIEDWYLFFVFGGIVAALVQMRDYRPARTLLLAVVPVMLCFLLSLLIESIAPSLMERFEDLVGSSWVFTIIWLGTFTIYARNQQKSIETERLKREAELAKTQLIVGHNAELERLVEARTAELNGQKEELEQALTNLQAAQNRLIQSEKMASLGELTAGIAHEIQNPLNFVNNFAEVSVELVDELKEELERPELDTDYIKELADNLIQSQQKIHHHGRRADAIVKAMLQHSRSSTDERHSIDVNALCDEYLRLSYHGLRAKDKEFNAELLTQFDPTVGRITAAGQEIGRVMLNLFNNAFYSVSEKKKQQPATGTYMPLVQVFTKRLDGQVEIRVRDNGLGIPQAVIDKIYQPFFTTKPTGEGTGLGLSLSYDIITQGHGGTLAVNTVEQEFAEFIITLPASDRISVS
ncbi:ATP-binding protein [Spirosoma agri]|uniref:histidine kinase n=1 Tax=Spirosoma agri TaxID=1987381 RepID=A0A6M0IJK6_9BACT|nr:ATP-binding protein [Spirosoma agri]NEU68027.1 histidine kinase [Spirosoma agri]